MLTNAVRLAALVLTPCLLCTAAELPWSDTWTMELRGQDRTYVDYGGSSYLEIGKMDLADRDFVSDKDVALKLKFAALTRGGPQFYIDSELAITGGSERWPLLSDGDNLYLLGHMTTSGDGLALDLMHIVDAPSDAELIGEKLASIPATQYQERLKVAKWVQAEAENQGNRTYWYGAAKEIVRDTVRLAASEANKTRNLGLLLNAMDWAIELNNEPQLAAEIGSAAWVREQSGDDVAAVAQRMQGIGYVFYSDSDMQGWLEQSEALKREYEQRLATIHWRDAEAFYELGRWADKHADVLPQARELSHRAYRAGHQGNPNFNPIRKELGLDPVAESASTQRDNDFSDEATGVSLSGPRGWELSPTPAVSGTDATWIDPTSDTALIAVSITPPSDLNSLEALWRNEVEMLQARPNFAQETQEDVFTSNGPGKRMGFKYQVGDELRPSQLVMVFNRERQIAVMVQVDYVISEEEEALAAFNHVIENLTVQAPPPPPAPNAEAQPAPQALPSSAGRPPVAPVTAP